MVGIYVKFTLNLIFFVFWAFPFTTYFLCEVQGTRIEMMWVDLCAVIVHIFVHVHIYIDVCAYDTFIVIQKKSYKWISYVIGSIIQKCVYVPHYFSFVSFLLFLFRWICLNESNEVGNVCVKYFCKIYNYIWSGMFICENNFVNSHQANEIIL